MKTPHDHRLAPARHIADILRGRAHLLHRQEGGAIMMAALAGTLILFMVSLVLYDAGNVMRKKVNIQVAADTAAYGQASIKARTMNTNAYANVAKRSIVAVAEVYHTSYSLYVRDMMLLARACSSDPVANVAACQEAGLFPSNNNNNNNNNGNCTSANPNGCNNAAGNSGLKGFYLAMAETFYDWDDVAMNGEPSNGQAFGGFVLINEATSPADKRPTEDVGTYKSIQPNTREIKGAMGKYNKELQQLTRYQEYMQKVTPWWAYMESVTRAAHNGATFAVSYPPPPALDPSTRPSWIETAISKMDASGNARQSTGYEDWRWPDSDLGRHVSLATNLRTPWNGDRDLNSLRGPGRLSQRKKQSSDTLELCHNLRARQNNSPYEDPGLSEEMDYNFDLMEEMSEDKAKNRFYTNAFALEDRKVGAFWIVGGYSHCVMDMLGSTSGTPSNTVQGSYQAVPDQTSNPNGYIPAINSYFAGPYIVMVERNRSALDMLRLSNIVFTYREGKAIKDGRNRFNYMSPDYTDSLPDGAKGAGSWTMSRSEIVTLSDKTGTLGRIHQSGEWHTNWTSRLRPVSFPEEFEDLSADLPNVQDSFMNAAFRDAFPHVGMLQQLGLTRDFDQDQVYEDLNFMERSTQAMDDDSTQGFFK
jgi:Flp pilus assembly protein TadG